MSTPADKMAELIRQSVDGRIAEWKAEKAALAGAAARIVELDALIAAAEAVGTTTRVAPKRTPVVTNPFPVARDTTVSEVPAIEPEELVL
jgi:hypothetical protein